MATHINIKIGEESFIAELLWDDAPETVEKTLAVLPLGGKFWHSGWMGDACVLTPDDIPSEKMAYLEPENQTMYGGRGDVLWFPGQPSTGLPYGEGNHLFIIHRVAEFRFRTGPTPMNLWARINDRLDVLDQVGMNMGGGIYKKGIAGGGGPRDILISKQE